MAKWCDGFDAGNFNAWDSETEEGSSTVAPDTTRSYTGPYSLKASHETGNFHAWVTHEVSSFSTIFVKARIWFNNFSFFNSENDRIGCISLNSGVTGLGGLGVIRDATGVSRWRLAARDGVGWNKTINETITVPLQEWIEIEIEWQLGDPGVSKLWVNGELIIDSGWDQNDFGNCNEVWIGAPYGEGLASTAEYWMDDVCIDSSKIPYDNFEQLPAKFFVGSKGTKDLAAEFIVQHPYENLKAIFQVGQGSADLFGEMEINHIRTAELYAKFFVGYDATKDLFSEFIVARPTLTSDLKAIFNAAQPLPNWLSGWLYRKKHTITGSAGGAQTNYQMRFKVNYGSGSDSGNTVYLDNKARQDFGDIRFTTSDGETELDYWIETKTDSSIAYIWVEVDSIPISPNTVDICLYYGNSVALTTSNGANTWINYTDFENQSVDTELPIGDIEAIDVYDYKVSDEQGYHGDKSLKGNDTSTIARNQARFNFTDVTTGGGRIVVAARLSNDYYNEALSIHAVNGNDDSAISLSQGATASQKLQDFYLGWHTITDFFVNNWYLIEICWENNADTWDLRYNDTWYNNRTKRDDLTDIQYANLYMAGVSDRGVGYWDFFALGKYVDAEPTNTSWGDEQTFGSQNLKAIFNVGPQPETADLKAIFEVGQESKDLFAKGVIRNVGTQDLLAETIIRRSASADLAARLFIADLGSAELKAVFCICANGTQNLAAEFIVQQPFEDLKAIFVVSETITRDLFGEFTVRQAASAELKAVFNIPQYEDLKAIFIIRENAANDLAAEFIVQQPFEDLKAVFQVRQPITSDLFAEFSVTSPAIVMPPWSKYASNPVWNNSKYSWTTLTPDNFVILRDPDTSEPVQYNGYYWAAYNTSNPTHGGIGVCYSTDLYNWVDDVNNPIISPWGGWEDDNLCPTEFLYMGNQPGHFFDYWIFYCAKSNVGQTAVGVAKSHNLVTWSKYASNPIASWIPSWTTNVTGIEDFRVLKASNGYWYSIYEANQSSTGGTAVGCAKSTAALPDSGWSDVGRLVSSVPGGWSFIANPAMAKKVIAGRHYYYSIFEAGSGGQATGYGMYCAEDQFLVEDGWTHANPYNALPAQPGWEDNSLIPNGMVFLGETLYIYYTGDSATSKQIGIATAPDFSEDLKAVFQVSKTETRDLFGEFTVRQAASAELKTVFSVQHSEDLYAEFVVRRLEVNLYAKFEVRYTATRDLYAETTIRQAVASDLKATFYTGLEDSQEDLTAVFIVRHETFIRRKVFATAIIRHIQAQDLKNVFKVSQGTITQDIPAVFTVDQTNGSKELLAYFNVRGTLRGVSLGITEPAIKFTIRKIGSARIR